MSLLWQDNQMYSWYLLCCWKVSRRFQTCIVLWDNSYFNGGEHRDRVDQPSHLPDNVPDGQIPGKRLVRGTTGHSKLSFLAPSLFYPSGKPHESVRELSASFFNQNLYQFSARSPRLILCKGASINFGRGVTKNSGKIAMLKLTFTNSLHLVILPIKG